MELSRRRSIKLKAQVDKLQESRDGPGWSQHRERVKVKQTQHQCTSAQLRRIIVIYFCSFLSQVTEEVLSVLRLLHPLTEPESSTPEPSPGEKCLDAALVQLQNVARKLAISHTQQQVKATATCTEIKLCTLITSLRSQFELILVGMLPRGLFALHILVKIKERWAIN